MRGKSPPQAVNEVYMKKVSQFLCDVYDGAQHYPAFSLLLTNIVVSSFILAGLCYFGFFDAPAFWAWYGIVIASVANIVGIFLVELLCAIFKR